MDDRRRKAEATAKAYIGIDQLLKELGEGAEGFVYPSPSATAVKVFTYPEKFWRELAAYQRLLAHNVTDVNGFAVPKLVNSDSKLLVIEMTIVEAPFIVDFAQSYLDTPFEFEEGGEELWWDQVSADFGDRFEIVQSLFYALEHRCGIYYYDLAPRNVRFTP